MRTAAALRTSLVLLAITAVLTAWASIAPGSSAISATSTRESSLVQSSAVESPAVDPTVETAAESPTAESTTAVAPSTSLHAGSAPHTQNGIVADNLSALREQEWKWVNRAAEVGEKIAFREMDKGYTKDPKDEPYCHQMVHELGRQSYLRHRSLAVSLAFETGLCGGGFSHGVFEAWGRTDGKDLTPSQLSAVCDSIPEYFTACGHGVGHAIMQSAPPLEKAIDTCSALLAKYQWPCIDGVTMMYAMSFMTPDPNDPRPDRGFNIKQFCNRIPSRWAERCEYNAGALWLGVTHAESRTLALMQCTMLTRDALAPQRCSYGIGETVLDQAGWDAEKVLSICRSGPSAIWSGCARNGLRRLGILAKRANRPDPCASLAGSDKKFCASAVLAPDERLSLT